MKVRPFPSLFTLAVSLSLLFAFSPFVSAEVLLSENFSGPGGSDSLDGKTPTFVHTSLTGVTWTAASGIGDDGTIADGNAKAFIDIGSYITNNRGNADAIYTVSATIDPTGGGNNWIAAGFYGNAPGENTGGNEAAVGLTLLRDSGDAEGWTFINGADIVRADFATGKTGPQTYGVTLDLSQWDGAGNYGSLTFFVDDVTSTPYSLTADPSGYIVGFGTPSTGVGTISDFQFSQIPEPGTAVLTLLGLSTLFWFRRKPGTKKVS